MVIRVYVTSISANNMLKRNQQAVVDALSVRNIVHEVIDISAPENEEVKVLMREQATPKSGQNHPLPPQIFNDDEYIGDYDAFAEALEDNGVETFFKQEAPKKLNQAHIEDIRESSEKSDKDALENEKNGDQAADGEPIEEAAVERENEEVDTEVVKSSKDETDNRDGGEADKEDTTEGGSAVTNGDSGEADKEETTEGGSAVTNGDAVSAIDEAVDTPADTKSAEGESEDKVDDTKKKSESAVDEPEESEATENEKEAESAEKESEIEPADKGAKSGLTNEAEDSESLNKETKERESAAEAGADAEEKTATSGDPASDETDEVEFKEGMVEVEPEAADESEDKSSTKEPPACEKSSPHEDEAPIESAVVDGKESSVAVVDGEESSVAVVDGEEAGVAGRVSDTDETAEKKDDEVED